MFFRKHEKRSAKEALATLSREKETSKEELITLGKAFSKQTQNAPGKTGPRFPENQKSAGTRREVCQSRLWRKQLVSQSAR